MKRLLDSPLASQALRGAALVVTDRRWAAPLSAAALGFGVFAGVAIGPGAAGTLATGAQQIVEIPSSGGGDGQREAEAASTESAASPEAGEAGGFEEALPASVPLAPEPAEAPPPVPEPVPEPPPAAAGGEEEDPEAQELKGTVVHLNPAAGSYAMAIAGGELVSVHAAELPEPGTRLSAPFRRLANGTFAADGEVEEEEKRASEVTFRGSVTYANPDPASPAYAVSGRGASLLVHVDPDPAGTVPALPVTGSYVSVTVPVGEGLRQKRAEIEPGPPSTYLDLAGIVGEVLPESGQILLSGDDTREGEADLTLAVPSGIDAAKLELGDSYLATATVGEDGSLTLAGIASDEHSRGANDPASAQGDLRR
jgi:hypothetical protein